MRRRTMLSLLLAGLAGCRPTIKGVAGVDWQQRLGDAIRAQEPDGQIQLDPVLLMLLVSFLAQLIKACLLSRLLVQHRAINRDPDGRLAKRWCANVETAFRAKHPDASARDVEQHVATSLEAFREASVAELVELHQGLQAVPADADWEQAAVRVARTLSE